MRPLDPRLLRHATDVRRFLVLTSAIGTATAVLVVVQAGLLATGITQAYQHGADVHALRGTVLALVVVVALRALLAWAQEVVAVRASAGAKSALRRALLQRAVDLGPSWLHGERSGQLAVLAGRGIDALDAYFSKYLPQLVLAVVVPLLVLGRVAVLDPLSFVTIALTLPLIPVFMALVGMATAARTEKQWATLETLAGHFLDVVAGLPTLKVFGRAKAQAQTIREVTERYRVATMKALRLSFLSALVLELLATISVALVAVGIGLRLVGGHLDLRTGLLVLILAPEAYLPLRQLGLHYHASAEGVAAAERVLAVLDLPVPERGTRTDVPQLRSAEVVVEALRVRYPGRSVDAVRGLSLRLRPGRVVAVAGPSGAGKSTVAAVLLGFVAPDEGAVRVVPSSGPVVALADLDPAAWRAQVAYLPQRPALFAGSLAENVRLARPGATEDEVRASLLAAGAADAIDELPDGLATVLGEGGAGLSTGQRRRVGLARVLLRDAGLVVLDEPTAGLDPATEGLVAGAIRGLADRGAAVLVVSHRPAVLAAADEVLEVQAPAPDDPAGGDGSASAALVDVHSADIASTDAGSRPGRTEGEPVPPPRTDLLRSAS